MKSLHTARKGFTLIELLVVIAIIAILASLAVPQITSALAKGQLTQTLNNARAIHAAAMQASLDYAVTQDPRLGWPGDLMSSQTDQVQDLNGYVKRLIEYDYIKRGDLGKLFAAPGVRAYSGTGEFSSENSAFKVYTVKDNDVGNVIFLATKNFTFNQGLDASKSPYGEKGAVIFRKGGDGVSISNAQAKNSKTLGFMPGSSSFDNPGQEGGNVWE